MNDREAMQMALDALEIYGAQAPAVKDTINALRAALAATTNAVRFCPECGHLGEVKAGARDCCPDGGHAAYMPVKTAERCRELFRAALAAPQPAQEPWMYRIWNDEAGKWELTEESDWPAEPLSTTPQAPQRQPLTDEQINAIFEAIPMDEYDGVLSIARAIEAEHGITKGPAA